MSYKTLNKDIKLNKTDNDHYDISIVGGDYETVEGKESLQNALRFALLLHFNELNNNPTYNSQGNKAFQYTKSRNIELTRLNIRESIKEVLENIRRVKEVNYVQVTPSGIRKNGLDIKIKITGLNDEEVKMEAQI